tara:strand:- start:10069 stop:10434 length:366 start_codon:yes stop_codon:yes gene_type:complete
MKEPENTTATVVQIESPIMGNEPITVAIKAKKDDHPMNPSGWSIIAFTPSASIRCVRGHQPIHLALFIRSIIAICGHQLTSEDCKGSEYLGPNYTTQNVLFQKIEEAVHKITQGEFNAAHN